jgi:glycosyltransferase involved in cell wall biosynthesis
MKVPEIASYLKKSNHLFQFIITAPNDNSKMHREFLQLVKEYEVEEMISIIGPVKKQYLQSLYTQINFVLLMSKLESFSNNIIEAWYFKKPLVVSDENWSKGICKNAAHYINRESSKEIAESFEELQNNNAQQKILIEKGLEQLTKYPSIDEKTKTEISFLEKTYNDTKTIN